jgi:hypothetical protein
MPARRKTTPDTDAALGRLFDARSEWERNERIEWPVSGLERTPGYTVHVETVRRDYIDGKPTKRVFAKEGKRKKIKEPRVWVLRKRLQVEPGRMVDADPLVTALWDTIPEVERRRSRLFVHCELCPVRFTKKGAMADAARCEHRRTQERKEAVSAEVRASVEPPRLVLDEWDEVEEAIVLVWDDLSTLHRRTLYAWRRPAVPGREWALEGAPSPEAFASRIRTAKKVVARRVAARVFPDVDYSIKTGGRPGFDYERFWNDWDVYLSESPAA